MRLPTPVAGVALGALVIGSLTAVSTAEAVDTAPIRTIADVTAASDALSGIGTDSAGRTYAGDAGAASVRVFAAGATGAATPERTIAGLATEIDDVTDIAVAPDGELYVVDDSDNQILVFAAGAGGDVAPVRSISGGNTLIDDPEQLALAADGTLVVGDDDTGLLVFAPGASGNQPPAQRISGEATTLDDGLLGAGIDDEGLLYASTGDSFVVFAADANGEVPPIRTVSERLPGPTALAIERIEVDTSGNVYTVDPAGNVVYVFPAGANGPSTPSVALEGVNTQLDDPYAVHLDDDRNLFIGNRTDDSITIYAPLVAFTKPSAASDLKVAGKKKDKSRNATWTASTDDGGDEVTYEIVVKSGGKTLLKTETTETSYKITRNDTKSGKHKLSVTATNRAGAAAAVSTTFQVAKIAPGKPKKLDVKGKKGAAKRNVVWDKPWNGGAKLQQYRVIVKKGSTTLIKKTIKASKDKLKLAKSDLRSGKHQVSVKARNAEGWGKPAKETFQVNQ
jgi:hypothetical protein